MHLGGKFWEPFYVLDGSSIKVIDQTHVDEVKVAQPDIESMTDIESTKTDIAPTSNIWLIHYPVIQIVRLDRVWLDRTEELGTKPQMERRFEYFFAFITSPNSLYTP